MLHFLLRPVVGGLAEVRVVAEHAVEVDRVVGAVPLHHGGGLHQRHQFGIRPWRDRTGPRPRPRCANASWFSPHSSTQRRDVPPIGGIRKGAGSEGRERRPSKQLSPAGGGHGIAAAGEGLMPQRLSREDFHCWAESQPVRYERVDGEPVAMSPERIQHVRVKARVWAALDRAIAAAGADCEALSDGVTIEIDDDTDYEPDAVVNCGPPASPSRCRHPCRRGGADSHRTAQACRLLPRCQRPALSVVSTRRREVVHHRRDGDATWPCCEVGAIALDPPGITIDIAELYPPCDKGRAA